MTFHIYKIFYLLMSLRDNEVYPSNVLIRQLYIGVLDYLFSQENNFVFVQKIFRNIYTCFVGKRVIQFTQTSFRYKTFDGYTQLAPVLVCYIQLIALMQSVSQCASTSK